MKTKFIKSILFGSVLALVSLYSFGQCTIPTPPTYSACGGGGQTAIASGQGNLNSGIYYSNSASQTVTGDNMNGATLYVCGTLTIIDANYWGGTIVVEPGGKLTMDNAASQLQIDLVNRGTVIINGGSGAINAGVDASFWNYGTMTVTGSLTFNGGSDLYNASTSATMTISENLTTSTPMVNLGSLSVGIEWLANGGNACLGPNSTITTPIFYEDAGSNYLSVSPAGSFAGLTVSNELESNGNSITSSTGLDLCLGTTATGTYVGDNGNPGNSIVEKNCSAVTLPVILSSFTAQTQYNNECTVSWTTAVENGITAFVLESSQNGSDFTPLTTVTPNGYPSTYTYTTTLTAQTWFRLKLESPEGTYSYSSVVLGDYLDNKSGGSGSYSIRIQPNLVTDGTLQVYCAMASGQVGNWVVVDMTGRTVYQQNAQLSAGETNVALNLPNLASGMYRLLFESSNIRVVPVPFSIIH